MNLFFANSALIRYTVTKLIDSGKTPTISVPVSEEPLPVIQEPPGNNSPALITCPDYLLYAHARGRSW